MSLSWTLWFPVKGRFHASVLEFTGKPFSMIYTDRGTGATDLLEMKH